MANYNVTEQDYKRVVAEYNELEEMEKWEWLFNGYFSPEEWMMEEWQ